MPNDFIPRINAGEYQEDFVAAETSARYSWRVCGVAAIAGLLFRLDIALINGAGVFSHIQFYLNGFQTELAVSFLLLGCIAVPE